MCSLTMRSKHRSRREDQEHSPCSVDMQDSSRRARLVKSAEPIVPSFGAQRPEVYRTIVQDDRHGATLDDIEHIVSNDVVDPVVRKS